MSFPRQHYRETVPALFLSVRRLLYHMFPVKTARIAVFPLFLPLLPHNQTAYYTLKTLRSCRQLTDSAKHEHHLLIPQHSHCQTDKPPVHARRHKRRSPLPLRHQSKHTESPPSALCFHINGSCFRKTKFPYKLIQTDSAPHQVLSSDHRHYKINQDNSDHSSTLRHTVPD